MSERTFNTALGLPLARKALRVLRNAGIYAPAMVTLEHQHLAKRYVVRGLEAGGAIPDLGRYVTFAGPDGERIAYLHPVESIAVNGLHAVVIAPVLVRVDMLRKGRTYEVLITEHKPGESENGSRPELESTILFRGIHGRVELDLAGKDKAQAGSDYLLRPKTAAVAVATSEPARAALVEAVQELQISAPRIETSSEGHGFEVDVPEMASALSTGSQEE